MNRSIGRFFSYLLYSALLIFVAGGAGWLLQLLLSYTPLHGSGGSLPANIDLVRALVLWGVSWLVGLPLVIVFARLIRRDRTNDAQAGGGGIRAFFLNLVEALTILAAVSVTAFAVIEQLGQVSMGDVTGAASFAILSLAVVAWIAWERRQARATSPAALVFQRLHLYGVQLLLLLILTGTWLSVSRQVIDALVFHSQGTIDQGLPAACGGFEACINGPNLLSLALATLWIAGFWIGYGVLAHRDRLSRWHQVTALLSLAWGLGYILFGLERGIELLLLNLSGITVELQEITGPAAAYDFASPLLFGLIVSGISGFWLSRASRQQAGLGSLLALWAEAVATFLCAVAFWWGAGLVLSQTFERAFGTPPDLRAWMGAVALLTTGIAYIPLSLHLYWRSHTRQIAEPVRSCVLALLGGGILTGVTGASVALYLAATSLLGSALENWQQGARTGLAALCVGLALVAIYLAIALHEHVFAWLRKSGKATQSASAPVSSATLLPDASVPASAALRGEVDAILSALQAGTLTREDARTRLLHLLAETPTPSRRAS